MKHDTFIFRKVWFDAISPLSDSVRLEVFDAICKYGTSDQQLDINSIVEDPIARGVFFVIKSDLDKMLANYDNLCAMRSEFGKRGAEAKWYKMASDGKSQHKMASDGKNGNNITQSNNIDISDKNNNSDDSNNSDISDRTTTRTHTRTRKKEETPVEERRKKFGLSLEPYLGQYPRKMLSRFYDHWGELTKDGKKMRWELEKTWELDRRLSKWASNEKFEPTAQSPEHEARIDKIEDAGEGAREILRQFYQQQTNVPQLNN